MAHGEEPEDERRQEAGARGHGPGRARRGEPDVGRGAREGGRRVELAALEDERDLPAEDVAQHPARGRGRDSHEDDDDLRVRHGFGDLRSAHREEREAERVRREKTVLLGHPSAREEDRPRRRRGDDGEVFRLAHPEHGEPAEEEVAERAAADRRDDRDDENPEEVEALAPAGERAAHREDEDAREIESLQKSLGDDESPLSAPAEAGVEEHDAFSPLPIGTKPTIPCTSNRGTGEPGICFGPSPERGKTHNAEQAHLHSSGCPGSVRDGHRRRSRRFRFERHGPTRARRWSEAWRKASLS